ncbi:AMP-binding enzyme [Streptomyces sp. INA 01156]
MRRAAVGRGPAPVPPTALGQTARELAEGATVITLVPATARLLATRQQLRARRARPGSPRRLRACGSPWSAPAPSTPRSTHCSPRPTGSVWPATTAPPNWARSSAAPQAFLRCVWARPCPVSSTGWWTRHAGARAAGPRGAPDPYRWGARLARHGRPRGARRGLVADSRPRGHRRAPGGRWVAPWRSRRSSAPTTPCARCGSPAGPGSTRARTGSRPRWWSPGRPDETELRAHAARHLAPYKVPDTIVLRSALPRTASGKTAAAARYRLTPRAIEAARAYKTSELLFALHELGALTALAEGTALAPLSAELGCDPRALEVLLDTAASLGLLSTAAESESAAARVPLAELTAFVRLEERLSRDLVTREALAAVARSGQARRPFERLPRTRTTRSWSRCTRGPSAAPRPWPVPPSVCVCCVRAPAPGWSR